MRSYKRKCWGAGLYVIRLFVCAASCLGACCLPTQATWALEDKCPVEVKVCPPSIVWLTGDVVRGDARRLADLLRRKGPIVSTIILAKSGGGSASEAIKIGRLIRRLRIVTAVGWAISKEGGQQSGSSSPTIYYPQAAYTTSRGKHIVPSMEGGMAICSSACVNIWLGGVIRFGYAYLAVHGPYVELVPGSTVSLDEIALFYRRSSEQIHSYYIEMGASEALWRLSQTVPWDQFKTLSRSYVQQNLMGQNASDALLLPLQCTSPFRDTLDVWRRLISMDQVAEFSECVVHALSIEREKQWQSVLGQISDP